MRPVTALTIRPAGHARYAAGDWVGAVANYLKAVKAAEPLT
jgi:hypothetical protein